MTTINTHGLTVNLEDLQSTSDYTETLFQGARVDIFYDRLTGEVWGKFFADQNSWCEYRYPEIIRVCSTRRHHSPQWIMDRIDEAVSELRHVAETLGQEYTPTF